MSLPGRWIVFAAAAMLAGPPAGLVLAQSPAGGLSAAEIMRRATERSQRVQHAQDPASYSYTKVSTTEELDSAGKVKGRKEKVWQVLFKDGETSARLVEVNGKPPAKADLNGNAQNEASARRLMGQPGSAKGDNRETLLTPELVSRLDFRLAGQEAVNGRLSYRLTFEPKAPTPPTHHLVDRLIDRLSGTLWIDAEEFELARANFNLRSEVSFFGGILGTLKQLAYKVERTRVTGELWLSTSSSGDFQGRKLLDSMRIKTNSRLVNLRPALG